MKNAQTISFNARCVQLAFIYQEDLQLYRHLSVMASSVKQPKRKCAASEWQWIAAKGQIVQAFFKYMFLYSV